MDPMIPKKAAATTPAFENSLEAQAPATDITSPRDAAFQEARRELDSLVGMTTAKNQIYNLLGSALVATQQGQSPDSNCNIVLTGSTGSGKSTVAHIFGKLLSSTGFLEKGHVVTTSPLALVSPFVGGTETNLSEAFKKAAGGILFIDDIFPLTPHEMVELGRAFNLLRARMEQEDGERVVVVLAGDQESIDALFTEGQGLANKFSQQLHLPDYSPAEMTMMSKQLLQNWNIDIPDEFYTRALVLASIMALEENPSRWNGRFARDEIVDGSIRQMANRVMPNNPLPIPEELKRIQATDLPFERLTGIPWSLIDLNQLQWELTRENGDVIPMDADTVGKYFANMTDHRVLDDGQPELTPASKEYLAELMRSVP
jgi:SpoVK/Ycf46/Vps4 family AAA+-type ATPase